MLRLTIFLIMFILMIISANAIEINDTILNATESNTTVKIFEWINVTNITIESNYIFFANFSKTSYIYNKNTGNAVILIASGITDYNFTTANTIFYIWRNATGLPSSPPPSSGGGGGGTPPSCNSLWLCEDWSSCSNNIRQRSCIDLKGCNEDKPPLLISCSIAIEKKIYGCVTFSELDKILVRWKFGILNFDVLNEAINKWKWRKEC